MSRPRVNASVALLAVAAALLTGCGASSAPAPGAAPTTLASSADNRRAAEAELATLLGSAQVPPGAERVTGAPVAFLAQAPQTEGSPNFISLTAWWLADEPYADALAWIQAHPPADLSVNGGGYSGGPGVPANRSLSFRAPDTPAFSGALLITELVDMGGRTGIRVDAQAIWLPGRPADEFVPSGTAVTLVVQNHFGSPDVTTLMTKRLDGGDGNVVIADVNALSVSDGGVHHCAMDTGYRVLIGVMITGIPEVFDLWEACNTVLVTRGGKALPALTADAALVQEITRLVGPPPVP